MRPPGFIVHSDWGSEPAKRVCATALLLPDGRYLIEGPRPVGPRGTWRERLGVPAADVAPVLIGFDFPIGLPAAYARKAGIQSFRGALHQFGRGEWTAFYDVCRTPAEIGLRRPFYPRSSPGAGIVNRGQLTAALELSWEELYRRCERATETRRAASPLFWTLGGSQVGKAAISGWRDFVQPLAAEPGRVGLWPFDGALRDLLDARSVVVAETYPTEFYGHLGIVIGHGAGGGKRSPQARLRLAGPLLQAASAQRCVLGADAHAAVIGGFGPAAGGEDAFDALIGVLGMVRHVRAGAVAGQPSDAVVRSVEGWILGQRA